MRVTNNMIIQNSLYNMNRNLARLDKRNTQLSTGKRISRPSDDPVSSAKALKLRTDVSEINQYKRNVEDALSWLEVTESAIDNIESALHRARELTVRASTETLSKEDRQKIADEINQLKEHIIQIGNTSYAGRYIFSGYQTDRATFRDDGTYNIDTTSVQIIRYQTGIGEEIDLNVFGRDLFGGAGGPVGSPSQLIEDFNQAIIDLNSDNTSGISNFLTKLDNHMEKTLSIRSEIGAKTGRLELIQNRLDKDSTSFTKLLSENEDVDMAETIMHLKMEESVYRASLAAGARVIQPTLLDFIR